MVNPLEIRVALNATTNQGLAAHQELAGQQYKQLQELKTSHKDSLTRPTKVTETKEDQAAAFKRIENPGDESPRKQELFDRNQERHKQREEAFVPYAPKEMEMPQKKRGAAYDVGSQLDFVG